MSGGSGPRRVRWMRRISHRAEYNPRFACRTIASGPRRSTTPTRSSATASRMFTDMGVLSTADAIERLRFRDWLAET